MVQKLIKYPTDDYTQKKLTSVDIETIENNYNLIFKTENSYQSIFLTLEQLNELQKVLKKVGK